jgi:hypothetical protein
VNFLEPITTSAADEEEAIMKAGTQESITRKAGSRDVRKNGPFKHRFLDS